MSLINQLNATTEYYWYQTRPEDIVNKVSALAWKLMGKALTIGNWEIKPNEVIDGGLMVKVPLLYGVSNSGSYGKDTIINQSKKDLVDAARFRWAGAYGSNTLNLDDHTMNEGPEAVIDLTNTYLDSIKKAIRVKMAQQLVGSAADGDAILGLGDLFNTNTATEYGSISTNQMAAWSSNVITTVRGISFAVLQEIFRKPAFGGYAGTRPNFCCTTEALVDGYEQSLHPQQRYEDKAMIEAGWENVTHKRAPIVADPYYAEGVFDALNLNFLSLRSHRKYNFTLPEWVAKKEQGKPDEWSANTRWRGNLYCNNRQMHVRHTGLTPPV
ncbi:MAG TPA: phage major capsid protein [Nitrospirae bacterium]|nr:phage major capsid protein [Nitrospirota bacterium]